ncbi:hypothetical protein [Acetobacter indonesiensis]|uniref:Uncharacterized protein n=1 Tax=Acetobacter indonesiensis TaxID=104101 RepID=A0A252AKB3_9PROT|nr:hypothetical protein [Acetobacter indonesiensis]OUI90001.1 hypothetical protein HK17_15020 [Acetobacter indonesiensis]
MLEKPDPILSTDPTIEAYDQSEPVIFPATPFLAITLLRSAELWSRLHPFATQGQRMALVLEIAAKMGVDVGSIG